MDVIEIADKHVQVNDYYAESAEEFNVFWQGLKEKYAEHSVDFCFHNCEVPIEFMVMIGAKMLESCVETRLLQEKFSPVYGHSTGRVTNDSFAAFAKLHDEKNPDMYWTGEKIGSDLSRWYINTFDDSYVLMSLWDDVAEIFVLETEGMDINKRLLTTAAAFAFEEGKASVLYMIDTDAPARLEAARLVGFTECGRYTAYRGYTKEAL
jgi:hypothetical protein